MSVNEANDKVLLNAIRALDQIENMWTSNGVAVPVMNAMQDIAQNALMDFREAITGETIDDLARRSPEFIAKINALGPTRKPPNLRFVE
jgi:hypothetical protein